MRTDRHGENYLAYKPAVVRHWTPTGCKVQLRARHEARKSVGKGGFCHFPMPPDRLLIYRERLRSLLVVQSYKIAQLHDFGFEGS